MRYPTQISLTALVAFLGISSSANGADASVYRSAQYPKKIAEWEREKLAEAGVPPPLVRQVLRRYGKKSVETDEYGNKSLLSPYFSTDNFIAMHSKGITVKNVDACIDATYSALNNFYTFLGLTDYCMNAGDASFAVDFASIVSSMDIDQNMRTNELVWIYEQGIELNSLRTIIALWKNEHQRAFLTYYDIDEIRFRYADIPQEYLSTVVGTDTAMPSISLHALDYLSHPQSRYFTPAVYVRSLLDAGMHIGGNKRVGFPLVADLYYDGLSAQQASDLFVPKKDQTFDRVTLSCETLDAISCHDENIEYVLAGLESIPDVLQRLVMYDGGHIVFTHRPLNHLSGYEDVRKDTRGAYNYSLKKMVVLFRNFDEQMTNTALHEFGHAVDDLIGENLYGTALSETNDFKYISTVCDSLSPIDHTPAQIFAEGFRLYYTSFEERYSLWNSCPSFLSFMQRIESEALTVKK